MQLCKYACLETCQIYVNTTLLYSTIHELYEQCLKETNENYIFALKQAVKTFVLIISK